MKREQIKQIKEFKGFISQAVAIWKR